MTDRTTAYDIFLSYSRQDQDWVAAFTQGLQATGIRNWFDLEAVRPGERWSDILQDALRESETLIVFLSADSVRNPSVLFEVGAAVGAQKRIIPILVGEIDPQDIPAPLAQRQVLRSSSPIEAAKQVAEILDQTSDADL